MPGLETLTIFPALAAARVTEEPVKVYLPKDRVSAFKFNTGSSMKIDFLAKTRTSISDLSTNGSSGLTSPYESDDEEDVVFSKEARTEARTTGNEQLEPLLYAWTHRGIVGFAWLPL